MLPAARISVIKRIQRIVVNNQKCAHFRTSGIIVQSKHYANWNKFANTNSRYFHNISAKCAIINLEPNNIAAKLEQVIKLSKESSNEDLAYLLQYCGKELSNEHPSVRAKLCETFWNNAQKSGITITLDQYNSYIQTCIDNEVLLNGVEFIQEMKCEPSQDTYKMLIENNCTLYNIDGALNLLTEMKYKQFPVDKRILDMLVLGHTLEGGLEGGEAVIKTMKTTQLSVDYETYWNLLKGLSSRKDYKEFVLFFENYNLEMVEDHFLDVLLRLGAAGNHKWLTKLKEKLLLNMVPRSLINQVENVCTQLISRNYCEASVFFYTQLVESTTQGKYGFVLLKEMLKKKIDVQDIIKLSQQLKEFNEFALENITEYALFKNYEEEALAFLASLDTKRPHYFWPLFLSKCKRNGEIGVFEVLTKMKEMNVNPDSDTLEFYCLPFCDISTTDCKLLIRKFQPYSANLKLIVASIIAILLKREHVGYAAQLCDEYNVLMTGERFLKTLAYAWLSTKNNADIIKILQKICESNDNTIDVIGLFLIKALKMCRSDDDFNNFLSTLKLIADARLRISTSCHETLLNILQFRGRNLDIREEIEEVIQKLLDIAMIQEYSHIKHPRDMNVEELECHLTELISKNMESRGVLRRLILEYCRLGNSGRVQQLQEKFVEFGYRESAGIKGVMLHTYIQNGHLNQALDTYTVIKSNHPEFKVDEFKIVDLATVLVKNDRFNEAVELIKSETGSQNARGGRAIERNCWRLLNAIKEPANVKAAFELLTTLGYCKASNIILGPLVKVHLLNNDIETALQEYMLFCENYRCTPLQLELLRAIVKAEREDLLKLCLESTSKVHGAVSTRLALLAALAENCLKKPITKFLMETPQLPRRDLQRRYDRWIVEDKLYALETLAAASSRLPPDVIDLKDIHLAIVKIFSMKNDCQSALKFWIELQENEVDLSDEVHHEILSLLERCNYEVPEKLLNK